MIVPDKPWRGKWGFVPARFCRAIAGDEAKTVIEKRGRKGFIWNIFFLSLFFVVRLAT